MRTVNMHEAKTHLSRLVRDAVNGEPFIIARAGKPVVKVVSVDSENQGSVRRTGVYGRFCFGAGRLRSDGSRRNRNAFRGRAVIILLDTQVLLWAASMPQRLPDEARDMIRHPGNEPVFSAASLRNPGTLSGTHPGAWLTARRGRRLG